MSTCDCAVLALATEPFLSVEEAAHLFSSFIFASISSRDALGGSESSLGICGPWLLKSFAVAFPESFWPESHIISLMFVDLFSDRPRYLASSLQCPECQSAPIIRRSSHIQTFFWLGSSPEPSCGTTGIVFRVVDMDRVYCIQCRGQTRVL